MRRRLVAVTAIAVALATVGAVALAATDRRPAQLQERQADDEAVPAGSLAPLSARRAVTGWLPYWDLPEAMSSVLGNPSVFAEVSPFWYRATTSATVAAMVGNDRPESELIGAVDELHAAGIAALPTVKDDGFDGAEMARLLGDRTERRALVADVVAMVARTGADGVEIDFEGMNFGGSGPQRTAVKRLYPVFLGELQDRLHTDDKTLAVALPPRRSRTDSYWEVIDYAAIARVVDRARVMTYDYSTDRPGPVSPYGWTKDVAEYARKEFRGVPLSIGVPGYGRNWYIRTLRGTCPAAVTKTAAPTAVQAFDLADQFGARQVWSKSAREYHYDYRRPYPEYGRCVTQRTVWFGEARSAQERLLLAKRLGVQGIAVFSFGFEDPRLLKRATQVARGIDPTSGKLTIAAPDTASSGEDVTVAGTARVLGVPIAAAEITLQRRVPNQRWRDVATAVSDDAGHVTYEVSVSKTFEWRLVIGAGWDWSAATSAVGRTIVS
jgi:spore germination protein YaaH